MRAEKTIWMLVALLLVSACRSTTEEDGDEACAQASHRGDAPTAFLVPVGRWPGSGEFEARDLDEVDFDQLFVTRVEELIRQLGEPDCMTVCGDELGLTYLRLRHRGIVFVFCLRDGLLRRFETNGEIYDLTNRKSQPPPELARCRCQPGASLPTWYGEIDLAPGIHSSSVWKYSGWPERLLPSFREQGEGLVVGWTLEQVIWTLGPPDLVWADDENLALVYKGFGRFGSYLTVDLASGRAVDWSGFDGLPIFWYLMFSDTEGESP